MNLSNWLRKKRVWRALAAVVLLACAVSAFIWMIPHNARNAASHNDCAAVEKLGEQWNAMTKSVTALESGPGERVDLLAIADSESAMSEKIRAAAGSVSNPALKAQLEKWAQGTAVS